MTTATCVNGISMPRAWSERAQQAGAAERRQQADAGHRRREDQRQLEDRREDGRPSGTVVRDSRNAAGVPSAITSASAIRLVLRLTTQRLDRDRRMQLRHQRSRRHAQRRSRRSAAGRTPRMSRRGHAGQDGGRSGPATRPRSRVPLAASPSRPRGRGRGRRPELRVASSCLRRAGSARSRRTAGRSSACLPALTAAIGYVAVACAAAGSWIVFTASPAAAASVT